MKRHWPALWAGILILLATGCGATTSGSSETTPSPVTPTLQILSPKDGDTVQAPMAIRYVITGVDASRLSGTRLRVSIGDPATQTFDLALSALEGTVQVPDQKMTSGHHDLSFSLVTSDGAVLKGANTVMVTNVTIVGLR